MSYAYLDNNVVRNMIKDPIAHNKLYDWFIKKIGPSGQIISSYYLFFEYIGFTQKKLNLPIVTPSSLQKLKNCIIKCNIAGMDNELEIFFKIIFNDIKERLKDPEIDFKKMLTDADPLHLYNTKNHRHFQNVENCTISKEIENKCFGEIINKLYNNFPNFIEEAAEYIAWDIFCSITPKSLPGKKLELLRLRQFGFFLQYHENHNLMLPFGKIIDQDWDTEFKFKSNRDMVDAELISYAIIGYNARPISLLTYDKQDQIKSRVEMTQLYIIECENTLNRIIPKFPGTIYCLDRETHTPITEIDISFPILLP